MRGWDGRWSDPRLLTGIDVVIARTTGVAGMIAPPGRYHLRVIQTRTRQDRLRTHTAPLWRAYLRVPRLVRCPATALLLLFVTVILANLVFASARTVERSFLIPPGESRIFDVQVDPGRNSEVSWAITERDADVTGFPLLAVLTGPSERQESGEGHGVFRFKGGFTTAQYRLRLSNEAQDGIASVSVRWILR
jgi:hypothetical protein